MAESNGSAAEATTTREGLRARASEPGVFLVDLDFIDKGLGCFAMALDQGRNSGWLRRVECMAGTPLHGRRVDPAAIHTHETLDDRVLDAEDDAAARAKLLRVAGLARLALNAVQRRRDYPDGKLQVDAADVADVLSAIAEIGRQAREEHQVDRPAYGGMDWPHLWATVALLNAEGTRWLEVHNCNPPECDLAAAEAALQLVVELSEGTAAKLVATAARARTSTECG